MAQQGGLRGFRAGFTIIEIVIVIAVLGILSGIIFVSYVGVQGQVRADTAKTYTLQASKKLLAFASDSGGTYPAALSEIGLTDGPTTKYQYTVDNISTSKTYCVTVTYGNKSFYIAKGQAEPLAGGCSGHSVDGLIAAPTNFTVQWTCGFVPSWTAVSGATSYVLQYDDASNFATPVGTINNATSGVITYELTDGTYARVAAVGPSGQGVWSSVVNYGSPPVCDP